MEMTLEESSVWANFLASVPLAEIYFIGVKIKNEKVEFIPTFYLLFLRFLNEVGKATKEHLIAIGQANYLEQYYDYIIMCDWEI